MKKITIFIFLFNCVFTFGQLLKPITFEDGLVNFVSTIEDDSITTFEITNNIEDKYLNKSQKVLKVVSVVPEKATAGISINEVV